MYHKRDYNFRKYQSTTHTRNKQSIVKHAFHFSEEKMQRNRLFGVPHKLDKNKAHCSCPICSQKRKNAGYTYTDKRKYLTSIENLKTYKTNRLLRNPKWLKEVVLEKEE